MYAPDVIFGDGRVVIVVLELGEAPVGDVVDPAKFIWGISRVGRIAQVEELRLGHWDPFT